MSGSLLFALGPPKLAIWATPVWIFGVGALLGLAILAAIWGVTYLVSRRTAEAVPLALREGPLWPIFIGIVGLAVFGVVGWLFASRPREIVASMVRFAFVGETTRTYDIAPSKSLANEATNALLEDAPIDVDFLGRELVEIRIRSNQNVEVSAVPHAGSTTVGFHAIAGEDFKWTKTASGVNPFPTGQVDNLYVQNLGEGPATMQLTWVTRPEHREAIAAPVTALIVVAIVLLYMLQRGLAPKLSAVALSTSKSEMAQPVFLINVVLGALVLVSFIYIPYYTLGEDIKMLKNTGMTLIMVLCIMQAIWAASNSIADEIEGRTALTVLSKPLSRWQFILGKYAGIAWATGVLFLWLSTVFLACVAYKPVYETKEGGVSDITWETSHYEVVQTVPGLALAFMETAVLAAVSVAISTRLPMMANFIVCFSIYVLGHLTPLMVEAAERNKAFEPVVFIGRLIATIFPVLENLNIQAAVAGGREVPLEYLGWALLYSLLYGVIAMLLALTLFEDRDLA